MFGRKKKKDDLIKIQGYWSYEYENLKKTWLMTKLREKKEDIKNHGVKGIFKNYHSKREKTVAEKEPGVFRTMWQIQKEAKKCSPREYKRLLIFNALHAVGSSVTPKLTQSMVDSGNDFVKKMDNDPTTYNSDYEELGHHLGDAVPFIGYSILNSVNMVSQYYLQDKMASDMETLKEVYQNEEEVPIYEELLDKPKAYTSVNSPASFLDIIDGITDSKSKILANTYSLMSSAIILGVATTILSSTSIPLAIGTFGATYLNYRYQNWKADAFRACNAKYADMERNAQVVKSNLIENNSLIQAANKTRDAKDKIMAKKNELNKFNKKLQSQSMKYDTANRARNQLIMQLLVLGAGLLGMVADKQVGTALLVTASAWQISSQGTILVKKLGVVKSLKNKMFDYCKRLITPKSFIPTTGKEKLTKDDTKISVKNVIYAPVMKFDYENKTYEEIQKAAEVAERSSEILHGVSTDFDKGQLTVLVGETGAGKSTLAKLIDHQQDTEAGDIFIGEKNVKDIDPVSFSSHVTMVDQDVSFFNDTIGYNIKYFKNDISEEELFDVCKKYRVADTIMKFGEGRIELAQKNEKYKKELAERKNLSSEMQKFSMGLLKEIGINATELSGGEKKRLALVRAVLADSSIIILDEPTSGLDPVNASKITDEFKNLSREKNVILITHNSEEIKKADRCVILDKGNIIADASPLELMQEGVLQKYLGENNNQKVVPAKDIADMFVQETKDNGNGVSFDFIKKKRMQLELHKKVFVETRKRQLLKDRKQKGLPLPEKKKREPLNPPSAYKPINESTSIR